MSKDFSQFEKRKQDHIELALKAENQTSELNPFDSFSLMHEALPDLNFNEITIATTRFGKTETSPFLVSSMTAGHQGAKLINQHLIEACAAHHWAMGVGSQRRELTDPDAAFEWKPLRQAFPNVSLFSNLGIAQAISSSIDDIKQLTETLNAQALIIHCNPLQECIQPEGTPYFKDCWQTLEKLVNELSLPIVIKETGCGFSLPTLKRLNTIGIAAVDVSGVGGTHWGRLEGQRALKDVIRQRTSHTFRNWGINTVQSTLNAALVNPTYEIWGSGGVRNGLDAAKLFALGAKTVGFAKPMLDAALQSTEQVSQLMQTIEYELKVALFCTGSLTLADLKGKHDPT